MYLPAELNLSESESKFFYSVLLWNNHLPICYRHRHSGSTAYRLQARPAPTGPGLRLTAMPRPNLPFNGRHPRGPWNYMDHYSFTDPGGMEGWVGLVGWPIADALPTKSLQNLILLSCSNTICMYIYCVMLGFASGDCRTLCRRLVWRLCFRAGISDVFQAAIPLWVCNRPHHR